MKAKGNEQSIVNGARQRKKEKSYLCMISNASWKKRVMRLCYIAPMWFNQHSQGGSMISNGLR
jgi:hypothetical protein